jgi:hypothetical protein
MDALRLRVIYDGAGPVHWDGGPGAFGLQDKDEVLHPVTPAKSVARGDEIGMFHLGSTAVVLLEPGLSVGRPLGKVRFGESLLRAG